MFKHLVKHAFIYGVLILGLSTQGHAADLTLDLGTISPPTGGGLYNIGGVARVCPQNACDLSALSGTPGFPANYQAGDPTTDVYNFYTNQEQFLASAPSPLTYDLNFSLSAPTLLQADYQTDSFGGSDGFYDTISLELLQGGSLITSFGGANLGYTPANLTANTEYTLELTGTLPQTGYGEYYFNALVSAAPSAVPLPATLPLFGAAFAGLAGIGFRKSRRSTNI